MIAKELYVSYSLFFFFQIFSFNYLEMVEKDYESIPRQKEEGNSTDPGEDDVQHSVVGGTQFIFCQLFLYIRVVTQRSAPFP